MIKLQDKITAGLAGLGPKVEDAVVDAMVDREVNKRSQLLVTNLDHLARLKGELKKIDRADVETYDAEGKVASSSFTKERVKAIKEAKEKIEKLEKALTKAIDDGDFSNLQPVKDS